MTQPKFHRTVHFPDHVPDGGSCLSVQLPQHWFCPSHAHLESGVVLANTYCRARSAESGHNPPLSPWGSASDPLHCPPSRKRHDEAVSHGHHFPCAPAGHTHLAAPGAAAACLSELAIPARLTAGTTMKKEKPRSLAPRARVCGVHAGRTLEWFYEDCGCCVCALCRTLGPHRGHGIHLMTHGVRHNQVSAANGQRTVFPTDARPGPVWPGLCLLRSLGRPGLPNLAAGLPRRGHFLLYQLQQSGEMGLGYIQELEGEAARDTEQRSSCFVCVLCRFLPHFWDLYSRVFFCQGEMVAAVLVI